MSTQEQAQYLKNHPKSKKAQQSKKEKETGKHLDQMAGDDEDSMDDLMAQMDEMPETTDEQNKQESKKAERMGEMIDLIGREKSIEYEAGSSSLSIEDAQKYADYLETINTPEGFKAWKEKERKRRDDIEKEYGPVTEETIDELDNKLKQNPPAGIGKEAYNKLRDSLMKKGGPPANATKGKYPDDHPDYPGMYKGEVRYKNVLRAYLETGGVCVITGEKVPIQDMQLDHIVSLDNGGKDEPGNWMFTKANINQFKSAKENPAIQADLEEVLNMTDEEWETQEAENKYKEYKKKEQREFWKSQFANGAAHPTEEQLNKMNKDEVDALIWAYNKTVPEDEQISRYPSQKIKIPGRDEPLSYTRGLKVRPVKDDPNTWGWELDKDTGKLVRNSETSKSYEASFKAYDESRGSGGRSLNKSAAIKILIEKGIVSKESDDNTVNEEVDKALDNHRKGISDSPEKKRIDKAKEKVKDLEKAGIITGGEIEKKVSKQLTKWEEDNPAPTDYRVKTGEDKFGNPVYKKEKIPTDKKGKPTKKGKKTNAYKEWLKRKQEKEYSLYRQEYYNTMECSEEE